MSDEKIPIEKVKQQPKNALKKILKIGAKAIIQAKKIIKETTG